MSATDTAPAAPSTDTNGVTAIAKRPPVGVDTTGLDEASLGALNAFSSAGNFVTAQRMAKALSESTMVPLAYQGNVPNCLIAIELASRIGASVFAVMQNMDIIQGRPGWRSTFLIATVNTSRRFSPLRFRWVSQEGKPDWGCRAWARDLDSGEECVGALIDWRMVKAEGWYERKGSKWQTMPEQMFMYRAAGFWTRIYCPEASLGMHTSEEVSDMQAIDVTPVQSVPGSEPGNQGRRMSLGKTKDAPATPVAVAVTASTVAASVAIQSATPSATASTTTTPHSPVTGEVKPPVEFIMSTSKQRSEIAQLATEARLQIAEVCSWVGKKTTTELSHGEAEIIKAKIMKVTGEVAGEADRGDEPTEAEYAREPGAEG